MEIVEVDYNKPETVVAAFKNVEKLFLLTTPLVDNMVDWTRDFPVLRSRTRLRSFLGKRPEKRGVMGQIFPCPNNHAGAGRGTDQMDVTGLKSYVGGRVTYRIKEAGTGLFYGGGDTFSLRRARGFPTP